MGGNSLEIAAKVTKNRRFTWSAKAANRERKVERNRNYNLDGQEKENMDMIRRSHSEIAAKT